MKPVSFLERARARFLPAPEHDRLPAPLSSRRLRDFLVPVLMVPLSLAAGAALRLLGRRGPIRPEEVASIAFVRVDHLGDVIQATPLMRALKAWNPKASLTVFARPAWAETLLRLAYVDEVEFADVPWIGPGSRPGENVRACLDLARHMRSRAFDLAIDLRYHNRLDSLLISLSGARFRLGFDVAGFGFGLTHRAPVPRAGHEAERGARAFARFGIPVANMKTDFPLDRPETHAAIALTAPRGRRGRGGPLVAVHVGAGNPVKRWMPERFGWVARELARNPGARIAVLAGRGEEEAGEPLVRSVPKGSLIDLRGKLDLKGMAGVLAQAMLFIGNDAGPGHVAAAIGTPSVIIFSGTNTAAQWAPLGGKVSVIEKALPCKPCGRTQCPFDQACLRAVGVDEVLAVARDALASGA